MQLTEADLTVFISVVICFGSSTAASLLRLGGSSLAEKRCSPDVVKGGAVNHGICADTNELEKKCSGLDISMSKTDCPGFEGHWCCHGEFDPAEANIVITKDIITRIWLNDRLLKEEIVSLNTSADPSENNENDAFKALGSLLAKKHPLPGSIEVEKEQVPNAIAVATTSSVDTTVDTTTVNTVDTTLQWVNFKNISSDALFNLFHSPPKKNADVSGGTNIPVTDIPVTILDTAAGVTVPPVIGNVGTGENLVNVVTPAVSDGDAGNSNVVGSASVENVAVPLVPGFVAVVMSTTSSAEPVSPANNPPETVTVGPTTIATPAAEFITADLQNTGNILAIPPPAQAAVNAVTNPLTVANTEAPSADTSRDTLQSATLSSGEPLLGSTVIRTTGEVVIIPTDSPAFVDVVVESTNAVTVTTSDMANSVETAFGTTIPVNPDLKPENLVALPTANPLPDFGSPVAGSSSGLFQLRLRTGSIFKRL